MYGFLKPKKKTYKKMGYVNVCTLPWRKKNTCARARTHTHTHTHTQTHSPYYDRNLPKLCSFWIKGQVKKK
jgi:hypothetical protein